MYQCRTLVQHFPMAAQQAWSQHLQWCFLPCISVPIPQLSFGGPRLELHDRMLRPRSGRVGAVFQAGDHHALQKKKQHGPRVVATTSCRLLDGRCYVLA